MDDRDKYSEQEAKKVLVVEDDLSVRLLLRETLRRQGVTVIEAGDGEEAIEKAVSEQPDIITLDERLPKRCGVEVARHLKSNTDTQHIPLIAVTANLSWDVINNLTEYGFSHYIPKPFQLSEIVETIQKHLRPAVDK